MSPLTICRPTAFALLLAIVPTCSIAAERTQNFDQDPGWDGRNHRATTPAPRSVRQDFGYSPTAHAGGKPGEIGGFITPAGEPAYYAKKIKPATFNEPLTASGSFACTGRQFHNLVGFFNADTVNEWRTPNSIALRLFGRGDVFYAYIEYATARWRAGGDHPRPFPMVQNPKTGRQDPNGFSSKGTHRWTLAYDPNANQGRGTVTATLDGVTAECQLTDGHKADGATFNRFGLLNIVKSVDDGGEVWLDDVTINGQREDFSSDPRWDEFQNRRTYTTSLVRPRFDFGFSPTRFAGGRNRGELGGLVYRGDCRYPERMAYYGDRLETLSLDRPLRASGKVALRRGVSDSGVLIGFFHAHDSMRVNPSQANGLPENFLGISTDAPSRDGFYFMPTYRFPGDARGTATGRPLQILPDGKTHDWTFEYSPTADDGHGQIRVMLDGRAIRLPLQKGHKESGARIDRFGLVTTWIDGNSQTIFFDDLTYTFRQD